MVCLCTVYLFFQLLLSGVVVFFSQVQAVSSFFSLSLFLCEELALSFLYEHLIGVLEITMKNCQKEFHTDSETKVEQLE